MWTGYFYGYSSLNYGYRLEGTQTVPLEWNASATTADAIVLVPVITWSAGSFEEWIWPDPTLGGLLPGMSSTGELLTTTTQEPA